MWLLFCKSINIFSLGFDMMAKYCKRLIKKKIFTKDHEKNGSHKYK